MSFGRIIKRTATDIQLRFTQGAVLAGLKLPPYGPGRYNALVFTARCDLANPKAELVHCLPIVPVQEWLRFEALAAMLRARIEGVEKKFRDALRESDPDLLPTLKNYNWLDLATNVFPNSPKLRGRLQPLKQLASIREQLIPIYGQISDAQSSNKSLATHPEVQKLFQEQAPKKMEQLLINEIPDAHYLPSHSEGSEEDLGNVVLFRYILSFPYSLVPFLKEGLLTKNLDLELSVRIQSIFFLDDNDPPGLIASVTSPHIEHILQRFSHLYARIGVDDYPENYKQKITNKACKEGK